MTTKPITIEYDIYEIDLWVLAYLHQLRREHGWLASEFTFLIGSRNNQVIEEIEDPSLKLPLNVRRKRKTGNFELTEKQISVYDLETFNTARLIFDFELEDCFKKPYFENDLVHVVFTKTNKEAGSEIEIRSLHGASVEYSYFLESESNFIRNENELTVTLELISSLFDQGYFSQPKSALDIFLDLRDSPNRNIRPYYIERALGVLSGRTKSGHKIMRKRTAGIRLEYVNKGF